MESDMRIAPLLLIGALLAVGACGTSENGTPLQDPELVAHPTQAELIRSVADDEPGVTMAPGSSSRPLAYVNGEVVTYRDVLRRIGPQLAVLREEAERKVLEDQSLLQILRQKVVYQAARTAQVPVLRGEIEEHVQRQLHELEQSGGTIDAYLRERGMTRREWEETIRRKLASEKYMLAAIGRSGDSSVRVRPRADTYVAPGEVRQYYERHPERFLEPATAKVRMRKVKTDFMSDDIEAAVAAAQAAAQDVRERLAAGEDWVPTYRSVVPESEQEQFDGLNRVRAGEHLLAPWIEKFAFDQPAGTLSEVRREGATFVLLLAEGAAPARQVPYAEVQASIRAQLSQTRRATASYEVEIELLQAASVQPESVRARLRDLLRDSRRRLVEDSGE
jgi:parvulin-like peptidyl-prolyl cis-trans isomerase-like protein/SurA-like protein